MRERLIENENDRKTLIKFIENQKLPFTAKLTVGRIRSTEQNRLQWLWATEAAAHRKDTPVKEVQAEWKLNFGVPILCADDEGFAAMWAQTERRMVYSDRLDLMQYLSVTSLMTSKQLTDYLSQIYQFHIEHNIELTDPEELLNAH